MFQRGYEIIYDFTEYLDEGSESFYDYTEYIDKVINHFMTILNASARVQNRLKWKFESTTADIYEILLLYWAYSGIFHKSFIVDQ